MDTDIPMSKLQSLLHAVAALYSGMFANVLHERVTAYHARTDDADDIGVSLHAYIKNAKQRASANTTAASYASDASETDPAATPEQPQHAAITVSPDVGAISNPLSEYFQKNKAYSELAPPLSEKLKASAWEHTHSAIRFAHQGDYASAKLHAALANNAAHELGHYLSEADFRAFKRAVKAELLDRP